MNRVQILANPGATRGVCSLYSPSPCPRERVFRRARLGDKRQRPWPGPPTRSPACPAPWFYRAASAAVFNGLTASDYRSRSQGREHPPGFFFGLVKSKLIFFPVMLKANAGIYILFVEIITSSHYHWPNANNHFEEGYSFTRLNYEGSFPQGSPTPKTYSRLTFSVS